MGYNQRREARFGLSRHLQHLSRYSKPMCWGNRLWRAKQPSYSQGSKYHWVYADAWVDDCIWWNHHRFSAYTRSGAYTGDSSTSIGIIFTTTASQPTVVM